METEIAKLGEKCQIFNPSSLCVGREDNLLNVNSPEEELEGSWMPWRLGCSGIIHLG